MTEQQFTPALGYSRLTPLYDSVIAVFTREKTWRKMLVERIAPTPGERILDVGCGTGSLATRIASSAPECEVIGLDPDPAVLEIAARKSVAAGTQVASIADGDRLHFDLPGILLTTALSLSSAVFPLIQFAIAKHG